MSTHEFSRLSSLDFEELTHDLLEADWKISLEAFATGRDGGIDLRYLCVEGSTVVQCKHYMGSGLVKLLANLRKVELPKVSKLNPKRYVLVTSVHLTPANKSQIQAIMSPYIKSPSDIFGASQIERLLRKYPDIEKTHYKLWLVSTAVLERVIHSAELCQTDFQLDRIQRKLPLFVQSDAYPRAMEKMEEGNVLIISGQPGIGKTTLAEMIIYAHLEKAYEPVTIQADISEGKKIYRSDKKQIFYFDDFLGQTYLGDRPEFLGRNQDVALSDFIEMIQRSDNARFILTTREHILGGALQRSERLANSGLSAHRYVLELAHYQRSQKARILYNHLYFSDLPETFKREILANDFFLKIINHENFNPRIIEWLSTFSRVKIVQPGDYQAHVLQLLDEPERIWAHAFETQISEAAKTILLALYTVGSDCELIDLQPTWTALHNHAAHKYNYRIGPNDFRSGLKELEGAFINLSNGSASFLNPSVTDFMAATFLSSSERAEDILESAIRFMQIGSLWRLSEEEKYEELRKVLTSRTSLMLGSLEKLLLTSHVRWKRTGQGLRGIYVDYGADAKTYLAIDIAEQVQTTQALTLVKSAFGALVNSWRNNWWTAGSVISIFKRLTNSGWVASKLVADLKPDLVSSIRENLHRATSDDWLELVRAKHSLDLLDGEAFLDDAFEEYSTDGVDDELLNCSSITELEELKDNLTRIASESGQDFSSTIRSLEERIESESVQTVDDDGSSSEWSSTIQSDTPVSDDALRGMFSTLVE